MSEIIAFKTKIDNIIFEGQQNNLSLDEIKKLFLDKIKDNKSLENRKKTKKSKKKNRYMGPILWISDESNYESDG